MEDSVTRYISLLELEFGTKLTNDDKEWLYNRSEELFESYYINKQLEINVISDDDSKFLNDYIEYVHSIMNKMFSHILILEFRLYLSNRYKGEQ
jgi:hypothetical protein